MCVSSLLLASIFLHVHFNVFHTALVAYAPLLQQSCLLERVSCLKAVSTCSPPPCNIEANKGLLNLSLKRSSFSIGS